MGEDSPSGFGTRNFTVSTEERVRALVTGPPAYMRRRRRIEDLEASIVRSIRAHEVKIESPFDPDVPPATILHAFSSLSALVEAHNRYYPIEAELPIDVATGEPIESGKRWAPMPRPTLKDLSTRAR
jgi:hypothetical protein